MRHGSAGRRHRHRSHSGNGGHNRGNNRAQVFDSNGPEVRIRGTAYQVVEKYMAMAKDAASAGDRVLAESYLQHAEHYQRVINSWGEDSSIRPAQDRNAGSFIPQPNLRQERERDLSLPASILGGSSNPDSKEAAARVAEATTV